MDVVEAVGVVVWTALGTEEGLWGVLPSRHSYAACGGVPGRCWAAPEQPATASLQLSPAFGLTQRLGWSQLCPGPPGTADAPGQQPPGAGTPAAEGFRGLAP